MLHYYATTGVHENFGNPDATARALVDAAKVATDKFFGVTGQHHSRCHLCYLSVILYIFLNFNLKIKYIGFLKYNI
jgi:hypothetical protein